MKILFMCVANSARSQLAEGLARHILTPIFEIKSAGSYPATLNSYAVKVMQEIGLDISDHYSKSVKELPPEFTVGLNYIITLCAEEVCPTMIAQNAKRLHWPFTDPATKENLSEEELLNRFRQARNLISTEIEKFKIENKL